jgi:hypothetical protein
LRSGTAVSSKVDFGAVAALHIDDTYLLSPWHGNDRLQLIVLESLQRPRNRDRLHAERAMLRDTSDNGADDLEHVEVAVCCWRDSLKSRVRACAA